MISEYGPALRRLAAAYEADSALQEDLFQEIALAVWRALPRFAGRSSLRTYIYRIAHNRAIRHLARRRREPETEEPPVDLRDPSRSPEAQASRRQALAKLMHQVRQLPLSMRQPLVLKLEGLTDREIGEALDLRAGTVSVRLTRARKTLASALEEPSLTDEKITPEEVQR